MFGPLPVAAFVGAFLLGLFGLWVRAGQRGRSAVRRARAEAARIRQHMRGEAAMMRRHGDTSGREQALTIRAAADRAYAEALDSLAERDEALESREQRARARMATIGSRGAALDERYQRMREHREQARAEKRTATELAEKAQRALEERAETTGEEVVERLRSTWLEAARAEAAQVVRGIEQSAGDPMWSRRAQRCMEIAVGRYKNHFLTERSISNIAVEPPVAELLTANEHELLNHLQELANVQLRLNEAGNSVRLEGLDGVGREVGRRALARLRKGGKHRDAALGDPVAWVKQIRRQLEEEIAGLGTRAFSALKLPRAHREIVNLVGRLNYRTSFTQNQWLHAVEASFLAGMMADELGLDREVARRATLLHDIGKALTHEMDGSHAVIGADIARRLGEDEVVANAIGAHHADEAPSSTYAFLVAGADAMSGARPGARREQSDGYNTRLQDLERIGNSYRGVDRCFAVHGGRELRVYVREEQLSDMDAVTLSSEIAERVAEELTFPGQIKVTVIRATEAVAIAS